MIDYFVFNFFFKDWFCFTLKIDNEKKSYFYFILKRRVIWFVYSKFHKKNLLKNFFSISVLTTVNVYA